MRKLWMILAVAALLVGCSKEEAHDATPAITIKAEMAFDAASRTTIKEQDGNYLARWTDEDWRNVSLVGIGNDNGSVWRLDAIEIYLENDGETATFDFAMYSDMTDNSYTFLAVNSHAFYASNTKTVWLTLKPEQTQDWLGYYDTAADLIVSKPIQVERPTGNLNLHFTMARLNALLKLSFKNLELAEGDKVASVTFACEQTIAGVISCKIADLDGVTYPIPYTLDAGSESKSIKFDLQAGGDLYLSTLPATLKAGESYTITVVTNQGATYQKSATLPADLTLSAGDITAVTVNMSGITPSVSNN